MSTALVTLVRGFGLRRCWRVAVAVSGVQRGLSVTAGCPSVSWPGRKRVIEGSFGSLTL